jgi:hypothetical protein
MEMGVVEVDLLGGGLSGEPSWQPVLQRSRFPDLFCRVCYTRPSGRCACGTPLFSKEHTTFDKKVPGA